MIKNYDLGEKLRLDGGWGRYVGPTWYGEQGGKERSRGDSRQRDSTRGFHGDPVAKTPYSRFRGSGFGSWSENYNATCRRYCLKNKSKQTNKHKYPRREFKLYRCA